MMHKWIPYASHEQKQELVDSGCTRLYSCSCARFEMIYSFGEVWITRESKEFAGSVIDAKYEISQLAMLRI